MNLKGVLKMEQLNDIEKKQMTDFIVDQGLKGRKRKWKKSLYAVEAMVVIVALAFGVAFPLLVRYVPMLGGMFERGDLHHQEILTETFEFANESDQTQYSDGVYKTLYEALFDGDTMQLTFLVESERDLSDAWHFNVGIFCENGFMFDVSRLEADGVNVPFFGLSSGSFDRIDDNSSLYTYEFRSNDPRARDILKNATDFEVFLTFTNLTTMETRFVDDDQFAEGTWLFQFRIEPNVYDRIVVNQATTSQDDTSVTISDLRASLVGIGFNYSYTVSLPQLIEGFEDGRHGIVMIEWRLIDDQNNILHSTGGGTSGYYTGPLTEIYYNSRKIWFEGIRQNSTQIIATPFVIVYSPLDIRFSLELAPIIIDLQ